MRIPNLLKRSRLIVASVFAIAVGIVATPWTGHAAGPSPAAASAGASTSASLSDAALIAFLQKHFKIPNPDRIKIGAAGATPIDGMFARPLTVSNDQGQ